MRYPDGYRPKELPESALRFSPRERLVVLQMAREALARELQQGLETGEITHNDWRFALGCLDAVMADIEALVPPITGKDAP